MASPEEILNKLLQSGQAVNPNAAVDIKPYLPEYGQTPEQQAQGTVDLQYNSQQRALEQAQQEAARENSYSRSIEENYGRIADPRVANVYSALGNTLTQSRQETQGNYQSAVDKIRSYYDEATAAGAGVNTDILNRLTQSAERLGVGAAIPDATKQLMSDYQYNQGELAGGKAGRSANLTQLASQIFGLDTGRISSAAQEGAQRRAGIQSEVLATLGELLREGQKEQRGYRSQLTGLKSDKALDLRKTLEEITQSRSKDKVAARQSAVEEFLQRSGLTLQQQGQQASLAGSMRDREIGQSQFAQSIRQQELDRAAANARAAASDRASASKGSDPLAALAKIAGIRNIQSQIADRGSQKLIGRDALETLLNSSSEFWTTAKTTLKGKGGKVVKPGAAKGKFGTSGSKKGGTPVSVNAGKAGPKFKASVQDILQRAEDNTTAYNEKNSFNKLKTSPYQEAIKLITAPDYKNMNKQALRASIDAYYKGYQAPGQGDDILELLMMQLLGG